MKELQVQNTQRDQRIDTRFLQKIACCLLKALGIERYEIGLHLVSSRRMASLNEQYLQHSGPTDVITFDLSESERALAGEIYVCVAVAEAQAEQFRTSWQAELVRYIVHGVLHLLGYDDLSPAQRKIMKRQENQLVKKLERTFDFDRIER